MKAIIKNTTILLLALFAVLFHACKENDLVETAELTPGIYFHKDSINYSFGVTPIEVTEYTLQIPLKVMGAVSSTDRPFEIKLNNERTLAEEGVHFDFAKPHILMADSVNAYLQMVMYRDNLEDDDYVVAIDLKENENFVPVNENLKSMIIYFNNRVEPPQWEDWMGNPTWPDFKLGAWNPLTWIKFMELFNEMEVKAPSTYRNMVNEFGSDLRDVEFGWPWDYDHSITKYILIPMYQYFMEENPELGVTIPRPAGY